MTRAAAVSFLNRLRPITASTTLRAFFIEGRRLHDIAQQFGYRETSLRSMVCRFRAQVQAGEVPPFGQPTLGRPQRQPQGPEPAVPETTVIADARALNAPSRDMPAHARRGGISLLPLLARVRLINWSAKPAIRAPRWCPRPVRC